MGNLWNPPRAHSPAPLRANVESPRARVPYYARRGIFSRDSATRHCARQVLEAYPRRLRPQLPFELQSYPVRQITPLL